MSRATDALLRTRGTDLRSFLTESRAAGLSAGKITVLLRDLTDGVVDVNRQTIYNWLADLEHADLVPIGEVIDAVLEDAPGPSAA